MAAQEFIQAVRAKLPKFSRKGTEKNKTTLLQKRSKGVSICGDTDSEHVQTQCCRGFDQSLPAKKMPFSPPKQVLG